MIATKAIIFDLDGVLLNSSSAHEAAFAQVFARFPRLQWSYADVAGMRTDDAIQSILAGARIPVSSALLSELVRDKRSFALANFARGVPVAADCVPILKRLAEHYDLAIGTSASQKTLQFFLDQTATASLFRCTVSGDSVAKAKPDPEIYRRCGQLLNLAPSGCVVVEDSLSGIESALAAGMSVIWLDHGEFTLPARISVRATISALSDLERNL